MDIEKIEKLMELLKKYDLKELKVRDGDDLVVLKDHSSADLPPYFGAQVSPFSSPFSASSSPLHGHANPSLPAQPAHSSTGEAVAQSTASAGSGKKSGRCIQSPFVGTFYAAPSPGSEPFVSVGQRIKKGDVLCIVEAMKLMNEIESEFNGVIKEILIENGQPVEFQQPLFMLED